MRGVRGVHRALGETRGRPVPQGGHREAPRMYHVNTKECQTNRDESNESRIRINSGVCDENEEYMRACVCADDLPANGDYGRARGGRRQT